MLVIKIHGQGTFGIVIPGLIVIAGSGLVQLGRINVKMAVARCSWDRTNTLFHLITDTWIVH